MDEHVINGECKERFDQTDKRLAQGDTKMALQGQAIGDMKEKVDAIHKALVTGNGSPSLTTRMALAESALTRQWWAIGLLITGLAGMAIKVIFAR